MPEAVISREIVWQDIGRHRPRGRTEYSNEDLKALLLPGSLVWKVTQARHTRHAPIPLSSTLTEVIDRKYGRLHEGLTVEFTADEWLQADIHALRFEDSLSMGEWLLVPPKRQRLDRRLGWPLPQTWAKMGKLQLDQLRNMRSNTRVCARSFSPAWN